MKKIAILWMARFLYIVLEKEIGHGRANYCKHLQHIHDNLVKGAG